MFARPGVHREGSRELDTRHGRSRCQMSRGNGVSWGLTGIWVGTFSVQIYGSARGRKEGWIAHHDLAPRHMINREGDSG